MFYETDVAAFLNDFGEAAIINHGKEIRLIFDNEYAVADMMGLEVGTSKPRAVAATTDVEDLGQDDLLEIRGISYRIVGVPQADGTGMTTLILTTE